MIYSEVSSWFRLALLSACVGSTACGPPLITVVHRVNESADRGHEWNGGLIGKQYRLVHDIPLVRQGLKRPVLAPLPTAQAIGSRRIAGPSRTLDGAWGAWGRQNLPYYERNRDLPCSIPAEHEIAIKGTTLTIDHILAEVLYYSPPVFYVQARINDGPFAGMLVDVSALIEDNVELDSIWRKRPIVANDEHLEPAVSKGLGETPEDWIRALNEASWALRQSAAHRLGEAGVVPGLAVPALLRAREDHDPEVCYEAMESLGRIGPRAEQAVPTLVAAMKAAKQPDGYCRRAANALAQIGRPVSPALVEALKDHTWRTRYLAAEALACLGAEAAGALPHMLAMLIEPGPADSEVYDTPEYIGAAIGRISPEAGQVALLQLLKTGPVDHRWRAARALGGMGRADDRIISALTEVIDHSTFMMRVYAITAVGKMGGRARPAVQAIIKAMEDATEPGIVADTAVRALGEIGPAAQEAVPAIKRYLSHCGSGDRRSAIDALQKINARWTTSHK